MRKTFYVLLWTLCILSLLSCGTENGAEETPRLTPAKTSKPEPPVQTVPVYTYKLLAKLPHDTTAFTQGITVFDGMFYESTGQYGVSELRRVDIMTGRVLQREKLGAEYFGEGVAHLGATIVVLTWMNQQALVYDSKTFKKIESFKYVGEGWGLTTDGEVLYMSNGTNILTVRDKTDFHIVRTLSVTREGSPQGRLNELEWINGEIWANVWQSEQIVRIDPATGVVMSVVDCAGIFPWQERPKSADVLNGIAHNPVNGAIYITGKNWPWVYQIEAY